MLLLDNTGTVRIWNTEIVQDTIFKLRLEKRALGGAILDMAWSPDSKQVVVVGNGKEKYVLHLFPPMNIEQFG